MERMSGLRLAVISVLLGGLLLGAQAAPTLADQAYATARQFYDTGHDQQAADTLEKFLTTYAADPRAGEAAFLLGSAQQRRGQFAKALEAYRRALTIAVGPEGAALRAQTHFQMGDCAWQLQDYVAAKRSYGYCLALSRADRDLTVRAAYWKAESGYQLKAYDEALADYRLVVETDAHHALVPWALYSQGMILHQQGRSGEAIPVLRAVVDAPDATAAVLESLLTLGNAYADQGKSLTGDAQREAYRQAVATLTTLLADARVTPEIATQARLTRANAHFAVQAYADAAAGFADAIPGLGSSEAMRARLMRGHALYHAEQYAEAAGEYLAVAMASSVHDEVADAHYWRANALRRQALVVGTPDAHLAAATALEKFLAAAPSHAKAPAAMLLLAFTREDLAGLGDTTARTQALERYTSILTKWAGTPEAKEAEAGIMRLTATMNTKELWALTSTLPAGAATWNAALRVAREELAAARYAQALAAATKVLDGKPTGAMLAEASYLAAASLHKAGRVAEAIPHYQRVLTVDKKSDMATYAQRGLAQALLDANRLPEARDAAVALITLPILATDDAARTQEHAERRMLLGEAYRRNAQLAEAQASYRKLLEVAPKSPLAPQALIALGTVAEEQGQRDEAIAAYQQVITRYPDDELIPDALFRLGLAYVAQKEYAKAVDALANVPGSYAQADKATYALAWAYRDMKEDEQANAAFARVGDDFPRSPLVADSLFHLGEYRLTEKNYPEAMRLFNRAMEVAGDSPTASLLTYKLGVAAYQAEDYALAVNAFGKVTANAPTSAYAGDSIFWRAASLEKQGEKQAAAARDAYAQYVTKYATGPLVLDAALGAGRAGLQAKQYAAARTDLRKALDLCAKLSVGPTPALADRAKNVAPEAQYYLGQTYFEEGQYDAAVKEFAAVAIYQYEPWYSRSLLQMARGSARNGDLGAAQRTLQLLLKNFPTSEAAAQAASVAAQYKIPLNAE